MDIGKRIKNRRSEISFLDLMAYTTASAIGFEIMESVVYMFSTNVPQILVRGITNMHACFGLIMGYVMAKGYKKNRKGSVALAILISTLIHGIYDLCLDDTLVDTDWGLVALLIAVFCFGLTIYNYFFMNKAKKKEYYTEPLFPGESGQAPAVTVENQG